MNSIKDISLANYIDFYETGVDEPETLPINTINQDVGSEFLETGEILKTHISDQFSQVAEKCDHTNPSFTLIKIFKKPKVERMVFRKDEDVIDTLYFYTDNDVGVRIYDNCYHWWTVLRFEYKKEDLEKQSEYYLHKKGQNSHQSNIKNITFEQKRWSLIDKKFIDSELENPNSEIIDNNLLTRDFQLFYMGNLMHEENNWNDSEKEKTLRVDNVNNNIDANFNYLIKKEISNYYEGE